MADLASLQVQLELKQAPFQAGVKQVDSRLKQMDRSVQASSRGLKSLESGFERLKKGALVASAALAAIGAVKGLTGAAASYQELANTLEVVTGSAENGAEAFANLKKLVQSTPFGLDQLTNSYIKLQAAGIQPTNELLMTFSDVASVTTDRVGTLQAMTDLFARTTAGGLGLEDLNRLADRGIPVFDILSKKMGLARLEVAEFGKTADGAKQILGVLTDELQNRFGGASQKNVKSLTVAFSNFYEEIKNVNAELFNSTGLSDAIVSSLNALSSAISSSVRNIKQFSEDISGSAVAMSLLAPAAIAASVAIGTKLVLAFKALGVAMAANPIGAVAVVLTAAATAIVLNWEKVKQFFSEDIPAAFIKTAIKYNEFMQSIALSEAAARGFNEEIARLKESLESIGSDRKFGEWLEDMDDLGDPFKEFTAGATTAVVAISALSKAEAKLLASLEAQAEAVKRSVDPMYVYQSELAKLDTLLQKNLITWEQYADAVFAAQDALDSATAGADKNLEKAKTLAEELALGMQRFSQDFAGGIVDGLAEGKLAMDDFAKDFLKMIAKIMLNNIVMNFLQAFGGSLAGSSNSFLSSIGNSLTSTSRVIGGTTRTQSTMVVGQVKTPTLSASSHSRNGGGVNITVNNSSGAKVETKERQGPNGTEIEFMIEDAVSRQMGSGAYDKVLQSRYGVARRGY